MNALQFLTPPLLPPRRLFAFPARSALTVVIAFASLSLSSFNTQVLAQTPTPPTPHAPPIKVIPSLNVPTTPKMVEGQVFIKYTESLIHAEDLVERRKKIIQAGNQLRSQLQFQNGTDLFIGEIRTYEKLGIQLLKLQPSESVQDAISKINQHPSLVEFAEPNYKVFPLYSAPPNDDQWVNGPISLWGMEKIGMKSAWELSNGKVSKNIIVAVLDTGIDYTHPDLVDPATSTSRMWQNSQEAGGSSGQDDDNNGIVDDVYGANFCTGTQPATGDPQEDQIQGYPGHGTIVAGVIGAIVNNGHHVAGVHRNANLMALKIMCAQPGAANELPTGDIASAMSAILYAIDKKAEVLNASWTIGNIKHSGLRVAIKLAGDNNALFVAAAGNTRDPQNNNDTSPMYPASYGNDGVANVMAVAGTMLTCGAGEGTVSNMGTCNNGSAPHEALYDGSSYGQTSVHIAAPGWRTISTAIIDSVDNPGGIAMATGTSTAAAHVSGCAALVQAARTAKPSSTPFSPKDLKALLMNNGENLSTLNGRVVNGRRLNCDAALRTQVKWSFWDWVGTWEFFSFSRGPRTPRE
ncbi:MAG: hypothetical protein E8D44_07080 [Nitrospira sp.]|nr:MAG: hypothetical protein E8D44_07080 [Nitrospira sp.]